jgi:hypothetical protein
MMLSRFVALLNFYLASEQDVSLRVSSRGTCGEDLGTWR